VLNVANITFAAWFYFELCDNVFWRTPVGGQSISSRRVPDMSLLNIAEGLSAHHRLDPTEVARQRQRDARSRPTLILLNLLILEHDSAAVQKKAIRGSRRSRDITLDTSRFRVRRKYRVKQFKQYCLSIESWMSPSQLLCLLRMSMYIVRILNRARLERTNEIESVCKLLIPPKLHNTA
jgi:hypothetical protein